MLNETLSYATHILNTYCVLFEKVCYVVAKASWDMLRGSSYSSLWGRVKAQTCHYVMLGFSPPPLSGHDLYNNYFWRNTRHHYQSTAAFTATLHTFMWCYTSDIKKWLTAKASHQKNNSITFLTVDCWPPDHRTAPPVRPDWPLQSAAADHGGGGAQHGAEGQDHPLAGGEAHAESSAGTATSWRSDGTDHHHHHHHWIWWECQRKVTRRSLVIQLQDRHSGMTKVTGCSHSLCATRQVTRQSVTLGSSYLL